MRWMNAARWAVVAAATCAGVAAAAPLKSDSVVKATAVAGKPDADGKQTVTLTLTIEKGWHIYANPVGLDAFAPVQTTVKVKAAGALQDVQVDYPPGDKVKDKDVGDYMVYEDKAVLVVHVTRAKGDDSPLDLSVKVQACNSNSCLVPAELKASAAP